MTTSNEKQITFDGYDGADLVVKRIAIWKDYNDRSLGMHCAVRHGHSGILLGAEGNACHVRVNWMGREYEGWVTFWFIKELKTDWQMKRLSQIHLASAQRHRPI